MVRLGSRITKYFNFKEGKMYTRTQVAEIFNVSPWTVFRWIQQGRIKAIKIGRDYRIEQAEIDYIKQNGLREPKTMV